MTNKLIWFDKGKFYAKNDTIDAYYDLADGRFHSGKTGKPYKNVMRGFCSLITSLIEKEDYPFSLKEAAFIMLYRHYGQTITSWHYPEMIQIEKILSLFSFPEGYDFLCRNYLDIFRSLPCRNIPLSKWAKMWKEAPEGEKKDLPHFSRWAETYLDNERIEKCKQQIQKYTNNEQTIDFFLTARTSFYTILFREEYLPRVVYYFEHGVFDYYYNVSDADWQRKAADALSMLFRYCQDMGVKPPKENWFVAHTQVLKNFNAWKNESINALLAEKQNLRLSELTFQNDNFFVLVPITSDQFIKEATEQRNCVNRIYKEKVANGETHVVFIRKKNDPEKSYITCEVNNEGRIRQYLTKNNMSPQNDEPAVDFYEQYQQHLTEVWNA